MASEPNTAEVYVQLLNEGTVIFRPTRALDLGDGIFRLLPTPDYDPEDEEWEFLPGTSVRCGKRTDASGDEYLIAIQP